MRTLVTYLKKNISDLRAQENELHGALKAWYLIPGVRQNGTLIRERCCQSRKLLKDWLTTLDDFRNLLINVA